MKRYLLFAGDHYYPSGGIEDYMGDYDTVEEAEIAGSNKYPKTLYHPLGKFQYDWWQVVDSTDMKMFSGGNNP